MERTKTETTDKGVENKNFGENSTGTFSSGNRSSSTMNSSGNSNKAAETSGNNKSTASGSGKTTSSNKSSNTAGSSNKTASSAGSSNKSASSAGNCGNSKTMGNSSNSGSGGNSSPNSQKVDCSAQNCQFLNNLFKNIQTAKSSIDIIIEKVDDEKLANELNNQKKSYDNISTQIACEIAKSGELPKQNNLFKKATTWTGLQMSTLLNTRTSHIADLMIQGSNSGILAVNKDKNMFEGCVESSSVTIADQLIKTYETNIKNLNTYL